MSPHYYYPTDHGWQFGGTLEKMMHEIGMFDRKSPLTGEGLTGSGADWLERYKPYLDDGATVVTSPHKVYGPQNNDLALQLRKRGISTSSRTPPPRPTIPSSATATPPRSRTSVTSPMPVLSTQDAVHELKR